MHLAADMTMSLLLSLQRLVSTLVGVGAARAQERGFDPEGAPLATTLRLPPDTRQFFESQAEAFRLPLNAFLVTTLEGVRAASLAEGEGARSRLARSIDGMADRLAHLLRAHGLDAPASMALLEPLDLSVSALAAPGALADRMRGDVADVLARSFCVTRRWLVDGELPAQQVAGFWYKGPQALIERALELSRTSREVEVIMLRRAGADFEAAFARGDDAPEEPIGFAIAVPRSLPDGSRYTVYERWESQRWNYQKCRLDAKALITWLARHGLRHGIRVRGVELAAPVLARVGYELLLVDAMQAYTGSARSLWHPEDYVLGSDSPVAKEIDELGAVRQCFAAYGLDALGKQ